MFDNKDEMAEAILFLKNIKKISFYERDGESLNLLYLIEKSIKHKIIEYCCFLDDIKRAMRFGFEACQSKIHIIDYILNVRKLKKKSL